MSFMWFLILYIICIKLQILSYKGKEWSGKRSISSSISEQSILTFEAKQCTQKRTLVRQIIHLFCAWMYLVFLRCNYHTLLNILKQFLYISNIFLHFPEFVKLNPQQYNENDGLPHFYYILNQMMIMVLAAGQ